MKHERVELVANEPIGENVAKVYFASHRKVTEASVKEWSVETLGTGHMVVANSFTNVMDNAGGKHISACIIKRVESRLKYDDSLVGTRFVAHGSAYFELEAEEIWERKQDDNGNDVLVRAYSQSFDDLLTEVTSSAGPILKKKLQEEVIATLPNKGDCVVYFKDGTLHQGTVTEEGSFYTILEANGDKHVTSPGGIVTVLQTGKGAASQREKVTDYYRNIYPENMAQQLT